MVHGYSKIWNNDTAELNTTGHDLLEALFCIRNNTLGLTGAVWVEIKLKQNTDMVLVILLHLLWQPNWETVASSPSSYFLLWLQRKKHLVSFGLLLLCESSGFSILAEVESGWQCAETGHHGGGRWRKCNTPGLAAAAAAAAPPCAQNTACQYCPHWPLRTHMHTSAQMDTWARSPRCLLICFVLTHTYCEAEGRYSILHSSSTPHTSLSKLHFVWWRDLSCWLRDRTQ